MSFWTPIFYSGEIEPDLDKLPVVEPALPYKDMPSVMPDLAGIEIAPALQRVGGRVETYLRILCMFRERNASMLDDIRSGSECGDLSKVRMLLHKLKGTARTLVPCPA